MNQRLQANLRAGEKKKQNGAINLDKASSFELLYWFKNKPTEIISNKQSNYEKKTE